MIVLEYDKEANAMYVWVNEWNNKRSRSYETRHIVTTKDFGIYCDLDHDGKIIGFEYLFHADTSRK